ncbi:MAG: ATP-binding protein [Anaerolineales bacterium]|nr:ATP-binding protein [Anaerolineales bacterium]
MPFIEAPSNFYLGRYYNPDNQQLSDEVVYYESRDLTTHAVVVGMTGSGKTGLCITLLEEAILDGIPAIIIDPKGDITNLLLAFPNLNPQDFLPWINQDDAHRAGLQPEEYAQDIAQRWREGLQSWGIGGRRIADYRNNAQFNIYTPGSDAGQPISILATMRSPRERWAGNEEYHREHIRALTTAILALIGMNANPVKDREHILISNLFEYAWRNGIDLGLQDIIVGVQRPPFDRLGAFDIETFFPEKERFKFALELNNIIAAPSFQSWLQGEPLDFNNLLYAQTPQGPKPRVSIFYIAHLNEGQRSFIITLILESILAGMRQLRGTSSLRALLYFDEVFGHFPPYPKNPPTKEPLLRLLKQARAFGIGTVLATQNPGDLDYKGLSNAGTWFIGRLQTENDKKKVLDGLSTASNAKNPLNIQDLDHLISSVDPRVFVMNNVHDARGPRLMHSRWAMSYLSGPLTRNQIQQLTTQNGGLGVPQPYFQQQAPAGYGQMAPQQGYSQAAPQGYGQPPAQPQQTVGLVPPAPPAYAQPQQAAYSPPQVYGNQPAFAPPPTMTPNYSPPSTPSSYQAPAAPYAAPPPPASLPEVPTSGYAAPPPPASLPESTAFAAPPPPQHYQPPAAPFGQAPAYGAPPSPPPSAYTDAGNAFGGGNVYSPPPAYQQAQPSGGAFGNPPTSPFDTSAPMATGASQPAAVSSGAVSKPQEQLPQGFTRNQPVLSSTIEQYFLPPAITLQQALSRWEQQNRQRASGFQMTLLAYIPFLLAQVQVRYLDRRTNVNTVENYAYQIYGLDRAGLIHWDRHRTAPILSTAVSHSPLAEDVIYLEPSAGLSDRTRLTALKKEVVDYISKTAGLVVPHNPTLSVYGVPGQDFRDYQAQVVAAAREGRDKEIDATTTKFEREFDRLEERYRREERELRADQKEFQDLGREELFTMGEAVFSLLKGRTAYTLSRVSRARRYKGQAKEDISESNEVLIEIENQMDELQRRFEYELQRINQKWNQIANEVQEVRITPYKKDIFPELFGVGWMPEYLIVMNGQQVRLPAWEARPNRDETPYALGPGQPYQNQAPSQYRY